MGSLLAAYRRAGCRTVGEVLSLARLRGPGHLAEAVRAIREAAEHSTAMLVVPGEPPGKNICDFVRRTAANRTKLIVAAQSAGLPPGAFERMMRASMPDLEKKLRIMDVGGSVAEAVESAERNRHYRPSQALEVYASEELARQFAQAVSAGSLNFDPTVVHVDSVQLPTDDARDIRRALESNDMAALHRVLDPHIFSSPDGIGQYKAALGPTTEARLVESLPPERRWPDPDSFAGIKGQPEKDKYGYTRYRFEDVPHEVTVPVGTQLFHGTSAAEEFEIPRGPGSFALDKRTAQLYADHEGEGIRPRVKSYVTTRPARCLDHPGATPEGERAAYWLSRWADENLGRGFTKEWGMIGYSRVPDKLEIIQQAGFDGIVVRRLDSGGTEVCLFDPERFVKPSGPNEAVLIIRHESVSVAGLCIMAADTGRVLMIQRALVDDDPAGGTWEFPGGHIEEGEAPLDAAYREWQEEVRALLPACAVKRLPDAMWAAPNGVYVGFVVLVDSERDLCLNDREQVKNPDDPGGDTYEAVAWWDPEQLLGMPALRPELAGDLPIVLDAICDALELAEVKTTNMAGNRPVNELAGTQAAPQAGPSSQMRGSNSSAWAGGRLVLQKPVNHVPEDENESERDHALDQDMVGGGLDWGIGRVRGSF